jgi:hypothetical protein
MEGNFVLDCVLISGRLATLRNHNYAMHDLERQFSLAQVVVTRGVVGVRRQPRHEAVVI